MSKVDKWMPMYWGDYARDTGHLNATAHGAYLMLIKHYWCSGHPITDDDDELWRIACCDSKKEWMKIRQRIVRFFIPKDGTLTHKRIDAEISRTQSVSVSKADAGRRGAAARWQDDGEGMADAIGLPMADGWQSDGHIQPQSQVQKESSLRESADPFVSAVKIWNE